METEEPKGDSFSVDFLRKLAFARDESASRFALAESGPGGRIPALGGLLAEWFK
jgi:hypothetical protein